MSECKFIKKSYVRKSTLTHITVSVIIKKTLGLINEFSVFMRANIDNFWSLKLGHHPRSFIIMYYYIEPCYSRYLTQKISILQKTKGTFLSTTKL